VVPVVVFILLGKVGGGKFTSDPRVPSYIGPDLPILAAIMIALSAVLSLATIVAIYREGGILKRLRATPMRPHTILTAHVVVKLVFTLATLVAMIVAGKRIFAAELHAPFFAFSLAVLFSTVSILSTASCWPASYRPPVCAADRGADLLSDARVLRPVLSARGDVPPLRLIARALPLTHAVSLMRGIWRGDGWIAHGWDAAALALVLVVCTALSAKIFRWE